LFAYVTEKNERSRLLLKELCRSFEEETVKQTLRLKIEGRKATWMHGNKKPAT
jgi:hypothetical protein